MSELTRQEKLDIAAATALTLVSWVAFWLFGFACGSVFWAQGF